MSLKQQEKDRKMIRRQHKEERCEPVDTRRGTRTSTARYVADKKLEGTRPRPAPRSSPPLSKSQTMLVHCSPTRSSVRGKKNGVRQDYVVIQFKQIKFSRFQLEQELEG